MSDLYSFIGRAPGTLPDGSGNATLFYNVNIIAYYNYWLPTATLPGYAELKHINLGTSGINEANFDFLNFSNTVYLLDSNGLTISDSAGNPIEFRIISIKLDTGNMRGITSANLTNLSNLKLINTDCFSDCSNLSSIIFPTSINSIYDNAFKNCTSLTNITLINSITYLGNSAFYDCVNLTNVIIRGSITALNPYTFYNCIKLNSVNLPNSIMDISGNCFQIIGRTPINELQINYSNGVSYLPTSLISLGDNCFNGSNIKLIMLPNTLTSIGDYCFANMYNTDFSIGNSSTTMMLAKNIVLPSSITNIGNYCFANCYNILNAIISYNSSLTIGDRIFWCNNSGMSYTSLTIPCDASNSHIPNRIGISTNSGYINPNFANSNLHTINISPGSPSIPAGFFTNYPDLQTIGIPPSVTYIGDNAFIQCSNLINDYNNSILGNNILEIPNTVKYIGVSCFDTCTSLQNVIVNLYTEYNPSTGVFDKKNPLADTLLSYIFFNCPNLTAATLPLEQNNRTLQNLGILNTLTTLTISNGVKNIVANACYDSSLFYTNLRTVNFPASLETIGLQAFMGCSNLNVSNLLNTVTLGNKAFFGVASLTRITSNGNIQNIQDQAFRNCTSLTSVDLPLSIRTIGSEVFMGCTRLNTAKINHYYTLTGTTPVSIGTDIFNGCTDLSSVILPLGGNYKLVNPFNITDASFTRLKEISISEDVADIPDVAMYNFNTVEKVNLLDPSLNSIGDRSFRNCKGLRTITTLKDLSNNNLIDNHAFQGCASLQTITMPTSVISVDVSSNYSITRMDVSYNNVLAGTYEFDTNKYTYVIKRFYDATDLSTNIISNTISSCDNVYLPPTAGPSTGIFTSDGICISQNNSLSSATGNANVQNWILKNNPIENLSYVSAGTTRVIPNSGATGYVWYFSSLANFIQIGTPVAIICFPFNTPIKTDQGIVKIGEIIPNIHTIRNKSINLVTKTVTLDKYLVCFEKDSLGKNIPSENTIMTKNHKVMHNGVMVMAKELLNKYDGIYKVKYDGEILYNILLDNKHDKLMVNNLICETLDPENFIAKMYKKISNLNLDEKNKIIDSYNDFVKTTLKKDPSKYKKYFK